MLPVLSAIISFQAADIKSTIEAFANATIRYDVATLERLTDAQFVEVSPLGDVDPREKFLSYYRVPAEQRGFAPDKVEFSEWTLRQAGDSISIAIYRQSLVIKDRKMNFRITTALQRKGAQWLILSNHVSPLRSK